MRRGYRERTDEFAQDVINAWNASSTNLSPEFAALLHKAILYKPLDTSQKTIELSIF